MAEHRMTEEERQSLLGLLPFSVDATLDYVPKPYRVKREDGTFVLSEEYQPVFTLRHMTRKEIDTFKAAARAKKLESEESLMSLVAPVVVGWRNLFDIGTLPPTEVLYKADAVSGCDRELFKASIPVAIVNDIGVCILRMNGLVGPEVLGLES